MLTWQHYGGTSCPPSKRPAVQAAAPLAAAARGAEAAAAACWTWTDAAQPLQLVVCCGKVLARNAAVAASAASVAGGWAVHKVSRVEVPAATGLLIVPMACGTSSSGVRGKWLQCCQLGHVTCRLPAGSPSKSL
jgi:hypothetical protein